MQIPAWPTKVNRNVRNYSSKLGAAITLPTLWHPLQTKLSDAILCITSLQDSLDWVFLFASVIVRFSFFDIIPYIYTIQPPLYWPSLLSVSLDHSIKCYVWHSLCLHSHNVAIITKVFFGNSFIWKFVQLCLLSNPVIF